MPESAAKQKENNSVLPPIPEKRFFSIGEVSQLCAVKPHVLRYWEQEFKQLHPNKRRGNRRYYQLKDVQTARQIRALLYDQGYTISGARQRLAGEKVSRPETVADEPASVPKTQTIPNQLIKQCIAELETVLEGLRV